MLKPKLLDQVRDAIMGKARRMMTEEAYVYWIKQCILFMLVQICSLNQTFCTVPYALNKRQSWKTPNVSVQSGTIEPAWRGATSPSRINNEVVFFSLSKPDSFGIWF